MDKQSESWSDDDELNYQGSGSDSVETPLRRIRYIVLSVSYQD